ncbi:MAG: GNAT family N-acetyltransferase [Acidimicrobiales bacterium]
MRVRVARPEEYERIGELTAAVYAGSVSEGYLEQLRDVAGRAEWSVVIVAVDDGDEVLGGVAYVPVSGADGEAPATTPVVDATEAGIRMLAVVPEARRQGAATALVEECIARARQGGRRRIVLYTKPSMTAAQRLYERLGFARVPDRDYVVGTDVGLLGYVLELDR